MSEQRHASDARLARVLEIKEHAAPRLRSYPNVTGVGVGYKEVNGCLTNEIALRVYVAKKVSLKELAPADVLPRQIDGIPVDVIEAKFRVHDTPAEHQVRHQLLKGGISVGNVELVGSGTLGAAVFDNISGQQMVLSNWHVLCGRIECQVGERIIQPGNGGGDAGTDADVIARLARWRLDDQVDAAVAFLGGYRFCTEEILNLGRVSRAVGRATLGQLVSKSGRTTGVTTGEITDVSADVGVDYGGILGILNLRNQVLISDGNRVSRPGDSGSLWVDENLRPVALNFAGGDSGRLGIANPIAAVVDALQINFGPGVTLQDQVVWAVLE